MHTQLLLKNVRSGEKKLHRDLNSDLKQILFLFLLKKTVVQFGGREGEEAPLFSHGSVEYEQ